MYQETPTLLLSIDDAAKLLQVKVSRLRTAVFKREIPFVRIGRLIRFKESDLRQWIDDKTVYEGVF